MKAAPEGGGNPPSGVICREPAELDQTNYSNDAFARDSSSPHGAMFPNFAKLSP